MGREIVSHLHVFQQDLLFEILEFAFQTGACVHFMPVWNLHSCYTFDIVPLVVVVYLDSTFIIHKVDPKALVRNRIKSYKLNMENKTHKQGRKHNCCLKVYCGVQGVDMVHQFNLVGWVMRRWSRKMSVEPQTETPISAVWCTFDSEMKLMAVM